VDRFDGGNSTHLLHRDDRDGTTCHTSEGNTDPKGGWEGYMVAERDRPTSDITYFLRIA
jgi:hypothetical protein